MFVTKLKTGVRSRLAIGAGMLALAAAGAGGWASGARAESAPAPAAPVSPQAVEPAGPSGRPVVSYADAVARVAPAVVTIRVELKAEPEATAMPDAFRRFFGPQMSPENTPHERGLGSGVIVSPDGRILTNAHVVDGAVNVRVTLHDGREFTGKVVGIDKPSDLAVVQVKADRLPTLALADSDRPRIGDVVLAVGNPLGLGETVTMGILSAKGRTTEGGDSYQDFLQTDAPINKGNSGGALVTADPFADWRQHRHRLRDSVEHGEARHQRAGGQWPRTSREARRHGAADDGGSRAQPAARGRPWRARQRRPGRRPRGLRGHP
jgi:S1-C subfamily serine protease